MRLSVVTSLYLSESYVEEFHRRMKAQADRITEDYEVIMVNDGSPDGSLAEAIRLCEDDPKLCVIDLSRNFGHHKALMTGLMHAKGDLVFLIDVDLEEQPELLQEFHDELQRRGADVIYGVQETRKGAPFERLSGYLFYRVFNWLSPVPIPPNLTTVRLMRKRYVEALVQYQDREVFLAGLLAIAGFRQEALAVHKASRGASTYSLGRKLSQFVNAITSFSTRPLVCVLYVGAAISAVSAVCILAMIVLRLFFLDFLLGWASLFVSVWFLGGLILFALGLVGIYLARVFSEVKRRPYSTIRATYGGESKVEVTSR